VEESEDVRVVEPREELGLLGRLHRLIGPEVAQGDLLQNLPGGSQSGTWRTSLVRTPENIQEARDEVSSISCW